LNYFKHLLYDYLVSVGFTENSAKYLNMLALLIALLLIVFVIDYLTRKVLVNAFTRFSSKTKSEFDNILVSNKVPRNIAHIIPLLITIRLVPIVFIDFQVFEIFAEKSLQVFAIVLTLWVVRSILNALNDFFKTMPSLSDKPIKSYIQVFMIFAWVIGILSAFAIVTGIPFFKFITAIGAGSAIGLLVFKDTILGFVASIQVSINDMVHIGDWITFEKYGADGDVIEISLATVKVQNFDKTITTIPTYALISDSFKNWRGMESSGGRRIKRAINIKLNTVKHLTNEDVVKLKSIELITSYLDKKQSEIESYNSKNNVDKNMLLNGRNLTNLGVFRKYIETYLENHSAVNKDMMIMTRYLAPTAEGIPLEIYAFSSDKRWKNYEYIMADIFDHAIASTPYFDLEIFEYNQNPKVG